MVEGFSNEGTNMCSLPHIDRLAANGLEEVPQLPNDQPVNNVAPVQVDNPQVIVHRFAVNELDRLAQPPNVVHGQVRLRTAVVCLLRLDR